jgi:hypothetical protein
MLGLEAVYGDYDVEELEVCPVSGNGAEGAGDDLNVNAAAIELGQDGFEFPVADEGIAADEGDVEGLMLVDYTKYVPDQSVILVV